MPSRDIVRCFFGRLIVPEVFFIEQDMKSSLSMQDVKWASCSIESVISH